MKKVLLFYVMCVLLSSCDTPQEKILKEFSSKLGIQKINDNTDLKNQYYKWENVDRNISNKLFDIADRELNMLPTSKERMTVYLGNSFHDINNYETPTYSISVKIYYYPNEENVEVGLFIKNK